MSVQGAGFATLHLSVQGKTTESAVFFYWVVGRGGRQPLQTTPKRAIENDSKLTFRQCRGHSLDMLGTDEGCSDSPIASLVGGVGNRDFALQSELLHPKNLFVHLATRPLPPNPKTH